MMSFVPPPGTPSGRYAGGCALPWPREPAGLIDPHPPRVLARARAPPPGIDRRIAEQSRSGRGHAGFRGTPRDVEESRASRLAPVSCSVHDRPPPPQRRSEPAAFWLEIPTSSELGSRRSSVLARVPAGRRRLVRPPAQKHFSITPITLSPTDQIHRIEAGGRLKHCALSG